MEFGSDFHKVDYPRRASCPLRINYNLYASGRQALFHLLSEGNWSRIWIPTYYCGESLEVLYKLPIKVLRYDCLPFSSQDEVFRDLPLRDDDILLRVNFFGMHGFQDSSKVPYTVIEDHTHDLIGHWASNSNADWCFASLRKTLPTPDGGILWSPKNNRLPSQPGLAKDVSDIMNERYEAMCLKTDYLAGVQIDKQQFLNKFRETEDAFSTIEISDCSSKTKSILTDIDIEKWYKQKRDNYYLLHQLLKFKHSKTFLPASRSLFPFSLIIQFASQRQRDFARAVLIENQVYTAILWPDAVPETKAAVFANCMFSIHCDARYNESDLVNLSKKLNLVL